MRALKSPFPLDWANSTTTSSSHSFRFGKTMRGPWCHVVRGCVVIEVKFMNHLSLYESLDTLGYYCQDDDGDDAGESVRNRVRGLVPGPWRMSIKCLF